MTSEHTVSGRKYSLMEIRRDHLQRMEDFGVLRKEDPTMGNEEIARTLESHGERPTINGFYFGSQA